MTEAEKIDCAQFFAIVSEYYDGELPARDRQLFREHFQQCPGCMRFFQGFIDTMKSVEGPVREVYRNMEIPADVEEKILRFLKARNGF